MTAISREFRAYGRTLEMVSSFKYLGRVILAADDNWPAATCNLTKVWAVWRRRMRILSREGARPRVSGFLKSRFPVGVALQCEDMGGYPLHGTGPGGFPVPGGVTADGEAPAAEAIWEVGVHLGSGGDNGGGV